jgi:hypothetical protein
MTPVSLFAAISETMRVSGRSSAATSSTRATPCPSTGK